MPRIARIVAPGLPHHITQRGNRRMDIFLDDDDHETYLAYLKKYSRKHCVQILAYCLMSNHVHLIAIPEESHSLGRMLADTHMRYAQHFNWKYSQSGHLWQGRFFSCVMDDAYTLAAARYVERNPVRYGLIGRAWDYRWSSARAHVGEHLDALLSDRWPTKDQREQWAELLTEADERPQIERIRQSSHTGRPLGEEGFIGKVELLVNRIVRPKKAGRRRKPKGEAT